ncbi:phage tail tape measure protein [Lentilactobacillus sp. IMAU92037]|uniref:phage tail tape measure protein n=1 Tax=Lentilactobacillus dabitei TaxID=2831523 RepID=UPI001C2CAA2D|nr:phage tail tape measure protein [Lentilactobacillus dabitei]MBV0930449.1 phage tail tape measure protein [Lentilactobacillus dabitei]
MGYARSAKVGFRVVSENVDEIDRANEKMNRLIRTSREANNQMSHLGNRMSIQGLDKFSNRYDSLISKSSKLSDRLSMDADKINQHYKTLANSSREYAKQISRGFSDISKESRNSINRLPKEKTFRLRTNLKQTKNDVDSTSTRVQRFGTKGKTSFDNLSRSGRKTTKSFRNLYDAGSRLSDMGTMVAMAMIPVAAAFKKSADEATNLQNRYVTIKNLIRTGGESSKAATAETKAMQKENNGFALKYGVSPVNMAKGGEDLIRRGYNGKQELGAHEYFLQAARASGDPYLSVVHNAAPAMESFGYKNRAGNSVKRMKDYTKLVTNQMAYASDLSATNFSGMGEALKFASQVAHSARESLASTTAAIGIMSNRGLNGTLAGTGLAKVINSFASPDLSQMSQQEPIMKKYHIKQSGFYHKNGQLKSLPDLLDYINHQTRHLTSSKKDDFARRFFGRTGQQAGLDLMELVGKRGSHATNNLRGLTRRVGNAQNMYGGKGYEERLAKKNMKSWKNQIKQFKQYLNIMGMGFAKTVLPAFTKALHLSNKLLGVLIKTPSPIKKLVGFTTAFAGILASAYTTSRLLRHGFNFLNGGSLFGSIGEKASKSPRGLGKLANSIGLGTGKGSKKLGLKGILKGKVAARSMGTKLGKTISAGVGIGVAADAGYNIYKGIKSKNKKKRYKDIGKGVGTAVGGGIGFYFGGPAGAAVGASIGNIVGGWAGKAVHKFSKTKMGHKIGKAIQPVTKAFKSAGKGISKSWSSTTKGLKKPFASAWKSISRNFKKVAPIVTKAFSSINKRTKPLQKLWRTTFVRTLGTSIRMFGHLIGGAFKAVGTVLKGIAGVVKGTAKIIGGTFSGINDLVHGRWSKAWKDAKSVFGGFFDVFKSGIDTIGGLAKDVFGTIGKVIGDAVGGIKGLISDLTGGKKSKKHRHRKSKSVASHALGTSGAEMHSHAALVGEGGAELAYTVNGRKARLLGANGPEITHVKHGERILNHRDTKKVLSGSYGNVLPGYAAGNTKLGSSNSLKSVEKLSKKTVKDYKDLSNGSSKQLDKFSKRSKSKWSNIHKATSKITNSTQKKTVTDYDQLQKGSYKQLVQFDKGNTSKWRNINSDTKHYTNQSKNQAISTYDSMQKGVQKQVNQMRSGVISSGKATATGFGHALGKMDNYAHSAMSNTVHQLNGGIKGIDKVLGQFGGNSSVINAIHYAKGSNGELSNDQLAIVNDAKSGPRQESIIRNNSLLIPHGNDRMIPLKKRDRVLNGSQTQELGRSMGIQHFAKGSGVSHAELDKIISKNNAHPNRAFANEFSSNISKSNTVLGNAIKGLSKRSTTKYGNPWSAEVWRQMDNARGNGGGSGAGGNWRHTPGLPESNGFNARRGKGIHDGVDFSGPAGSAIRAVHGGTVTRTGTSNPWNDYKDLGSIITVKSDDGYQEIYQEFGTNKNIKVHTGDQIKTGQAIATLGHLAGHEMHVHVGVSKGSLWKHGGYSHNGWFDVTKMHGHSNGNKKADTKHSSALSKLVAKEIAPQLKWVGKHLKRSAGSIGSLALSGDIASRAKKMAAAIKKAYPAATLAGIAGVLGNWEQESLLSPSAINSGDHGSGLGQWTNVGGSRRESKMRAYLKRHGMRWNNAGGQLDYALHEPGASGMLKKALRMSSPTAAANYFFSTWESGGNEDNSGGKRTSNARGIYKVLKGHRNGGWSSVPAIFGEKKGEPEVAINPKRKTADGLIASAIDARSKVSNSVFSNESQKKMHRALLENLRKYNPLKNMPDKHQPNSGKGNNVTVNLNMNITVNANDKNAGTKVANDISKQVNEQVQAIFGNLMAKREGGVI